MTQEPFVGQDIEGMRQLEAVLRNGEAQLASVRASTYSIIDMLWAIWRGDVMSAFSMVWRNQHARSIESAEASLRAAAETVSRNLEQQSQTSATLYRGGAAGGRLALGGGGSVADRIRELSILIANRNGDRNDYRGFLAEERREDFESSGGTDAAAGISSVVEALEHTADPDRIAPDEFEIVHLDNGKIMIVLPGVTDLTDTLAAGVTGNVPGVAQELGLDPNNRTVRDTWIVAEDSLGSASVENNLYARYVQSQIEKGIADGSIPRGADVMIVGHSFGADTALDLASDPTVNGELVNITHVVAAAYDSQHQLGAVQPGTKVAVLQNNYDAAIVMEGLAGVNLSPIGNAVEAGAVQAGESAYNVGGSIVNGATEGAAEVTENVAEGTVNAASSVGNFFLPGDPFGRVEYEFDGTNIQDVDWTGPTTTNVTNDIVVSQFSGGVGGAGHTQNHYISYIQGQGGTELHDFFSDVAASGYTGNGAAIAVDVSIPDATR